ncbi:MAG: 16S rRNA (cytidine(1402)-2'-O)-methyltransferase [Pseudomonadota bacterium]
MDSFSTQSHTLYVVATPIGNLQDITPRALDVLRSVTIIAAEDTRHSRRLLTHYDIHTPLQSLHEHNERAASEKLIARLKLGESIALVSDAGTPLVSDPGAHLVSAVHLAELSVIAIPGPSALISALSIAGMPADRFVFQGFLPPKATTRRQQLDSLTTESRTLVFYEAPHRILDTLRDMLAIFGENRQAAIIKELTKRHETVRRNTLAGLLQWLINEPARQKGEFVLVVAGNDVVQDVDEQEADRVLGILLKALPTGEAAKLTSELTGLPKKKLYERALRLKNKENR